MISLKAFAKVNLALYITGVRFDGYHFLDTVMQSVSLHDTVNVEIREDKTINVTCDNSAISGKENICYKAAELFFNETGIKTGADIYIEKRIPLASGLGGGSADAAAVLKALNMLYEYPLKEKQLLKIALKLGADVPFCVKGGTARVKGIGEEIIKLNNCLPLYMILIKDGEKPSTAVMYRELDSGMRSIPVNASADATCKALVKGDLESFTSSLYNDFSVLWDISEITGSLSESGAVGSCLSGSGPTVIGFFETEKKAEEAYERLKDRYSQIYLVREINE